MPFLIVAIVTFAITPVTIVVARRLGVVDRPGALKLHDRPTPLAGTAVAAGAVAALLLSDPAGRIWLLVAVAVALVTGLLDDRRTIHPATRLLLQGAAAAALIAGGAEISPLGPLGALGAAVVVIATINAVNMVDGQDGLAPGLVAIAGVGLAIVLSGDSSAVVPLAAAGAAAGFIPWNLPPARVFLGDGGAYVLGVLLAAGAVEAAAGGWPDLLAAGACLGVFAYELLSTVLRRLGHRRPTLAGDRDHAYDRLASRLDSRASSTYLMWVAGGIAALIGVAVQHMPPVAGVLVISAATAVAAAIHSRLRPVTSEVER